MRKLLRLFLLTVAAMTVGTSIALQLVPQRQSVADSVSSHSLCTTSHPASLRHCTPLRGRGVYRWHMGRGVSDGTPRPRCWRLMDVAQAVGTQSKDGQETV